jgi:hypothetical protein
LSYISVITPDSLGRKVELSFSGKRKGRYHPGFYVPPEDEQAIRNFIEAFRARNESASQKIVWFIKNYDDLIVSQREEMEHVISLLKRDKSKTALTILEKKLSTAGRINPQTRLSQFPEELIRQPTKTKCGLSNCERERKAVAIHVSGHEMPVCSYHMQIISDEPKWRIQE